MQRSVHLIVLTLGLSLLSFVKAESPQELTQVYALYSKDQLTTLEGNFTTAIENIDWTLFTKITTPEGIVCKFQINDFIGERSSDIHDKYTIKATVPINLKCDTALPEYQNSLLSGKITQINAYDKETRLNFLPTFLRPSGPLYIVAYILKLHFENGATNSVSNFDITIGDEQKAKVASR